MTDNNPFEHLMPEKEDMRPAREEALLWANGSKDISAAFQIADATGAALDFALNFTRRLNANVWGKTDGRASNGDEQDE